MNAPLLRCLCLALGLGLLVGCMHNRQLTGVTVSIAQIKPIESAAPDTKAEVTLNYANSNVVPIGTERSTHKLYLNGTLVGRITSEEPIGMPPLKSVRQTAVLVFEKNPLVAQLLQSPAAAALSYRLDSDITFLNGEDRNYILSRHEGTIDLRPLQGAK